MDLQMEKNSTEGVTLKEYTQGALFTPEILDFEAVLEQNETY